MVQVKVLVKGNVQGIGYRSFVVTNAKRLGLKGYVRNLNDGNVEAVFDGSKDVIEKMIDIMKTGHSYARVDKVEVNLVEAGEKFEDFSVGY